jgi:hypothetical protein
MSDRPRDDDLPGAAELRAAVRHAEAIEAAIVRYGWTITRGQATLDQAREAVSAALRDVEHRLVMLGDPLPPDHGVRCGCVPGPLADLEALAGEG